ncbi:hypothetical protein [Arenibaculum pallidiluteum]|uniref:hypothetical protein n=1 Tax=Arenibaculum pallidiluteum TaxID=2812559 RepID=UPI001A9611FA|nr:hypothetical protein [Arenibaculum pallidiluteum]
MAFRPNYNQQRADRNRVKEQRKQDRLQRKEAEAVRRRTEGPEASGGEDAAPDSIPDKDPE